MQRLDNKKKSYQESNITAKIIKENIDIVSDFVFNNFNNSLFCSSFLKEWKNTNLTPIFKKKTTNVENYRLVSILLICQKFMEVVWASLNIIFFETRTDCPVETLFRWVSEANFKTGVPRKQSTPNFPKNENFKPPWYAYGRVRIRG